MKSIIIVFLLIIGYQIKSFATFQASDILIWNSDTLYLDESPLESLSDVCQKIRERENGFSSACYNGFVAEWVIVENTLYLQNIYSYITSKNINRRLERILNRRFENGRLKANWYSGDFLGGFGRTLNCLYYAVYEKERLFKFDKGVLQEIKAFNAKNVEYSIDEKFLEEFIYQNFNWKIFDPEKEFFLRASIFIAADSTGKLKTIKFESSAGTEIDNEVERIVRLVPNWGTYYWNGKPYSFFGDFNLKFNNNMMNKYAH